MFRYDGLNILVMVGPSEVAPHLIICMNVSRTERPPLASNRQQGWDFKSTDILLL